jgi:hypothetical protein
MARDSDCSKHPWGADGHWPLLRLVVNQVGLQSTPAIARLASRGDTNRGLLVDVGLLLLRVRW